MGAKDDDPSSPPPTEWLDVQQGDTRKGRPSQRSSIGAFIAESLVGDNGQLPSKFTCDVIAGIGGQDKKSQSLLSWAQKMKPDDESSICLADHLAGRKSYLNKIIFFTTAVVSAIGYGVYYFFFRK